MTLAFKKIGLMGRHKTPEAAESFLTLLEHLKTKSVDIYIEEISAKALASEGINTASYKTIGAQVDLIIVVGGDGSLLQAARAVVDHGTPIIGINRGRLGFLTDIKPQNIARRVDELLSGKFLMEERFLIEASIENKQGHCAALNDIVFTSGDTAHMVEFEVYINDSFMCSERSDGIVIATPTGSTAYALSGGGPIVQPTLDALVLVPMFSHTLSSRPIVVPGTSKITIKIGEHIFSAPRLSYDGQTHGELRAGDKINITKKEKTLKLLHPTDYDYFDSVRSKLHWGNKLSQHE